MFELSFTVTITVNDKPFHQNSSDQPSRSNQLAPGASYWWINDHVHDRHEDEGVLWAPKASCGGVSLKVWENVRQLRVGHLLIHYSRAGSGVLGLTSLVIEKAREAPAPSDLVNYAQGRVGYQVRVRFKELREPIRLAHIRPALRALAPDVIKPNGYVRHGYAIPLTGTFVHAVAVK